MKINFEYDTPNGVFRDALYLPEDHKYTIEEIEAMKQERLNNWLYVIKNSTLLETETFEINEQIVTESSLG